MTHLVVTGETPLFFFGIHPIYIYISLYMCLYLYLYIYTISLYLYLYLYIYIYLSMSISIYIYISISICIFIFTYAYSKHILYIHQDMFHKIWSKRIPAAKLAMALTAIIGLQLGQRTPTVSFGHMKTMLHGFRFHAGTWAAEIWQTLDES